MRGVLEVGTEKKTINLVDNVVYAHVTDLEGRPLELKLSVMLQNGNAEMRLAVGEDDPKEDHTPKPALIFVPGGGWRGADKNLMLGEMPEFVKAGYVVASIDYRNSGLGKWPAQIEDVKTAIRFLRSHAEQFEIDPERIGIFGRSAGGQLSAFAAMNTEGYDTDEWQGFSSKVQCCIDMFGPTDIGANMDMETRKFSDPEFRWHTIEETHGGALIGGDPATIRERAELASPDNYVNDGMAPMMILHGDNDPIVPKEVSSDLLYQKIKEKGLEDRCEYYVVKHAGHGTREFFQDKTKDLMIRFFDQHLKAKA